MRVSNNLFRLTALGFVLTLFTSVCSVYAQMPVYVGARENTYDDPTTNIFYVSPTGNDTTADGTINKPYKSINTALGKIPTNSTEFTIVLREGTYREGRRVRVQTSNTTIKSAKGEWAVIDLTTYDSGNSQHSGVEFYAEERGTRNVVTGCKLQCVEVKGGFYAVSFETQWDWGRTDRRGASNIVIEDCILHHSSNDVVKIKPGCDNITIRYNEIHHSGQGHINHPDFPTGQRNSEGIDNVNGDSMHVHHNYIHDICSNGLYAKGGAINALIENNRVEGTYGAGITLGFDTSPEFFDTMVNPQYYENIGGIVRNNLIIGAGWEGIGLYASKDVQVYNNTLINVANYEPVARSPIYYGIVTQDYDNGDGCPANINPTVHHNLISQPSTSNRPMVDIRYTEIHLTSDTLNPTSIFPISGLTGNTTMYCNGYCVAGKSATFGDNRPSSRLTNGNLTAWKSHISSDSGSIDACPNLDTNYMTSEPQFAGMGIPYPLVLRRSSNPTSVSHSVPLSEEISAFISSGVLYIQSPVAETVEIYSIIGQLLSRHQKSEGKAAYFIDISKNTIIILRGSSGWTKRLLVQ